MAGLFGIVGLKRLATPIESTLNAISRSVDQGFNHHEYLWRAEDQVGTLGDQLDHFYATISSTNQ